jgi:hypothetical protein
LSELDADDIVEVTLNGAANVRLLDGENLKRYRIGSHYNYFGGPVSRSPYLIRVPHCDHWHLVIDLGGYIGKVRSSVRVLRAVEDP